ANVDDIVADLKSTVDYLKGLTYVRPGGLGVIGFCMGGNFVFEIAINSPDIRAAVPFYGSVRQLDRLNQTKAAILAIYGGTDTRLVNQSPMVEENLKAAGKTYEIKIYEGAAHAFFNDTGAVYNAEAAKDAWPKTVTWLKKYL